MASMKAQKRKTKARKAMQRLAAMGKKKPFRSYEIPSPYDSGSGPLPPIALFGHTSGAASLSLAAYALLARWLLTPLKDDTQ